MQHLFSKNSKLLILITILCLTSCKSVKSAEFAKNDLPEKEKAWGEFIQDHYKKWEFPTYQKIIYSEGFIPKSTNKEETTTLPPKITTPIKPSTPTEAPTIIMPPDNIQLPNENDIDAILPKNNSQIHTVKKGESLEIIAKKYGISDWKKIKQKNNLKSDQIKEGQKLIIP